MSLMDAAREVRERAYAPYSKFKVGAALRSEDGQVFAGCNVENVAYPEGTCAEAGAIAAMVAAGERTIVEVVVVTDGATPGTPCGGCRQRIREFAGPATWVHSVSSTGVVVSTTVAELLPHSFGPEFLGTTKS